MNDRVKFITKSDINGMRRSIEEKFLKRNDVYVPIPNTLVFLESFEDLLKRDEQREKDGFPKKIKISRIIAGPGKVIAVPYIEEEKFVHGEFEPAPDKEGGRGEGEKEGESIVGSGEGEVGDVIAERSPEGEGEGDDSQAGDEPGEHGIEAEAYKIGKELSEKFKLPNLKDKGKKVPTDEYIYDLTDRHRGSGQLLDKKETLKSIVKTNIALGRLDKDNIGDTSKLVVGPNDKVYRVLSREKVWKSQAIVFFARDYSGSMSGEPTKAVVTQHSIIYLWLLVQPQFNKIVIPRFIVHDTEAKEVTVNRYYRESVNGGTFIYSAFKLVNEIVQNESLDRDYSIYVFYGTDGDDFDNGQRTIPEIQKMLGYVNRMGVCVVKYYGDRESEFEKYIQKGNILSQKNLFRKYSMDIRGGVTDEKNIEAIKALIAQD